MRAWNPRGTLRVAAEARARLDGSVPPSGSLRAQWTHASCTAPGSTLSFSDGEVDLEARYDPRAGEPPSSLDAWEASARFRAACDGAPLAGWVLAGRNAGAGMLARAWLHADDVHLDEAQFAALSTATHLGEKLETPWRSLAPSGSLSLACGVHVPRGPAGEILAPALAVEVVAAGHTGLTFFGWPDDHHPGRRDGFPVALAGLSGKLVLIHDRSRTPATELAFLGAHGVRASDPEPSHAVGGSGMVRFADRPDGHPSLDVSFEGREVALDQEVRRALDSLPSTEWIGPAFLPPAGATANGTASVRARLLKGTSTAHVAGRLDIEFRGLSASWSELPMQASQAAGKVDIVLDARRALGAGFEIGGLTSTSERFHLAGRVQEDPALDPEQFAARERRLEVYDGAIENLALRGADRDVFVARFPGIGSALDTLAPAGKVDVLFRATRMRARAPLDWRAEIVPRQVQLSPRAFQMQTRGVRGRVLVWGASALQGASERTVTRVAPLLGEWPGDAHVACSAEFVEGGEDLVRLYGAGLDLSNRGLVGAFRQAFAKEAGGSGGLDLSALSLTGRVDVTGDVSLPALEGAPPQSLYRVYLRENDFESGAPGEHAEHGGRFGLDRLEGTLVQRDRELYGESIAAELGHTPLLLRQARFFEQEGAVRFETRPEARGLPLDREHMRAFLDEETIEALVGGLAWRGSIDVDDADLALVGGPGGGASEVEFSGRVTTHDMSVEIGLPLAIDSASVRIEKLVFEGGHVRARARVDALEGRIADRALHDTSLEITYVEPHLSILDLDGRLEGGRLRDLGTTAASLTRGGPAFSIDLAAPFPFDLGLRLENVQVAGLLRGLFESDFASRGQLSGEVRLNGSLDKLTGIRGDGSVQLVDTTLWSIPVIRELFSQLGFDNAAVFERMRTRFRIQDGVIQMNGIQVASPLLQLVGSGQLDLDGRLQHDLEVRYSLVDKLGPLTRLVYWVQSNLLSVAVRGDMSRPRVVLKGALALFQRIQKQARDLPLPGLSPLPERF